LNLRRGIFSVFLLLSTVSGALTLYYSYASQSEQSAVDEITQRLEDELRRVASEASVIRASATPYTAIRNFDQDNFYWSRHDSLIAWTNHHVIPPLGTSSADSVIRFVRLGSGDFILLSWKSGDTGVLSALVPLIRHYRINNDYLRHSTASAVMQGLDVTLSEPGIPDGLPVVYKGQELFRVKLQAAMHHPGRAVASALVFTISIFVVLVWWLGGQIERISKRGAEIGFVVLTFAVASVRLLLLFWVAWFRPYDSPLFDPKVFASASLNASLAEMFINALAILVLCHYLFRNYARFRYLQRGMSHPYLRWLLSVLSAVFILFAALFPFVVIQTIYNNSAISLSITTSLNVDSVRIITWLVVILSWISSWMFMHVFIRIVTDGQSVLRFLTSILLAVVAYILINENTGQVYFPSLIIALVYMLVVLLFQLPRALARFQYKTFVYFFTAVIFFAANAFVAVEHFERKEQVRSQNRFAEFLVDRDYFGEYLLADALSRIKSDGFVQARLASPLLSKEPIRQKIRQYFLPVYFNKYAPSISLFSTTGDPIENGSPATLSELLKRYDQEASKTEYEGVYYVAGIPGESAQQYVAIAAVHRNDVLAGYAVMQLSLKRVIPDNVYPELLVESRFQRMYQRESFSYAVYRHGAVQLTSGDFNYERFIPDYISNTALYTGGVESNGYYHVAAEDVTGKVAIVSAPMKKLFYRVADFSFLAILGVTVVFIYLVMQGIHAWLRSQDLSMASRIQVFLNLAFFIPLIAVSTITIGLTARSSLEQLNADYLNRARSFSSQLANVLQLDPADSRLEQHFSELISLSNADANLFDPGGSLVMSSQPAIFENQLLSAWVDPRALRRVRGGERNFVLPESVGELDYFVAYSALYDPSTATLRGVVALPFFQSGVSLERMLIAVLANILVIFTVLFLLLLIVSYFVSKWLTFPLRMVTHMLGKISLTKENQPLAWHSEDEIGMVVREYNQMLTKLGESKAELERTQRENAWREIAQQVAHEIKNPLTPMKLTLQQLEKSVAKGDVNAERVERSVGTLLTQVNMLDGIASSFSAFAKMPEPVMNEVDLVALLRTVEHLYEQEGDVTTVSPFERAMVMGDSQLLTRILSNMVLNGLQAVPADRQKTVRMEVARKQNFYEISIADNGAGIDPALSEKIFLPHFTTKQSGSGLGLAIARQGIEQMGGKVWFVSSPEGTTFYIQLPAK
jgi:two-component system nitrogen regulation sensor histidine kinase NtrY